MEENTSKVCAGASPLMNPMAPGAGSALFVINLCASIAPVQISGKNLPGLENYRLYQVARVEDGRTRHRLRLGFFTSESHARSILTVVRQQYPTAFTACLCDEDRRFARGYLPDGAIEPPAPKRPVAIVATPIAPTASPTPWKASTPKPPGPATTRTAAAPGPKAKAAAAEPAKTAGATPATPKASAPSAGAAEVKRERAVVSKADAAAIHSAAPKAAGSEPEVSLDDFTWEPPALQPPTAGDQSTSATARHPVLSPVFKTQPVMKPTPPAAPGRVGAAKADPAGSMRVKALNLTFSDPPAPPANGANARSGEPFHVGKGVDIGDLKISLQTETPKKVGASKAPPAPAVRATAPAAANKPVGAQAAVLPATSTKPHPAAKSPATANNPARDMGLPDLDSTQTIRALTSAELNDEAQEKWFAIQLAASEQPVNLDTMPHLDIFEAYRLYSVATAGGGKIIHSLRLGFFKEAVSAEAVSGYLKTFFGSPSVLRISVAEQARFKDAAPPKKSALAGDVRSPAKVVDLSDARAARPTVPTVTVEVPTPRTDATGSFRMNGTGSVRPNGTGSLKPNATGSFRLNSSGSHKVLTPTLKPAAKSAAPATRRSEPVSRNTGATGKYKVLPKKSLSEQLLEEAREVELSESGIRKLPNNGSLLSKLVGKLTR